MSSYLEFVIEYKKKDGNWRNFYQTTYDEATEIINPYCLKSLFWDTDHFSGYASSLNDLSDKSKCMFGEKIDEVNPFRKGLASVFVKYDKEIYDKPTYPYKHHFKIKKEGMSRQFAGEEFREYILNYLEHLMEKSETRFNKTWIEVNPEGLKKHFKEFSGYFDLSIDNLEEYEKVRYDLMENPDKVVDCLNPVNNIHFTNIYFDNNGGKNIYCWTMGTPYEWIEAIEYQPAFKDFTAAAELFGDFFGQIVFTNPNKESAEVPQFEIGSEVKVSYKNDVEAMLDGVKRELEEAEHSRDADNAAKAKVKEFLDDYEDDSKTDLYKALEEWVGDVENVATLEYINELKEQILHLTNLNTIMKEDSRLIWGIS